MSEKCSVKLRSLSVELRTLRGGFGLTFNLGKTQLSREFVFFPSENKCHEGQVKDEPNLKTTYSPDFNIEVLEILA